MSSPNLVQIKFLAKRSGIHGAKLLYYMLEILSYNPSVN